MLPSLAAKVIAIIPAAGGGRRMGGVPKALLKIAGASIVEHSLNRIIESGLVDRVVICMREEDRAAFTRLELGRSTGKTVVVDLIAGGDTRQISVSNALHFLKNEIGDTSAHYALVHDAARCLVTAGLVRRCVEAALEHKAITAAVPLVDSIKRADREMHVMQSLDRENIWCVQTPQVFLFDLLYRAHQQDRVGSQLGLASDDASLVEQLHPVRIVEGETANFKITMPGDLELARRLLAG